MSPPRMALLAEAGSAPGPIGTDTGAPSGVLRPGHSGLARARGCERKPTRALKPRGWAETQRQDPATGCAEVRGSS